MANYVEEYKLECYKKVQPLNSKNNLWVVEDSVTDDRFVMRKISMHSQEVCQILKNIRHPNILEVADVFSYGGSLYVIEEYLEWEPLSDAMNDRHFSRHDVFRIGSQLLEALSVLHEHKIIHRDLKPDNIMIDSHGNVKIIDFDIARLFTDNKEKDTSAKGSYDYAPPEQFGFSQTDCRTDIYSLGITLNEISIGVLPAVRICPGRLGRFVRRCTEFDPARRYQTAEQAQKHLKRLQRMPLYVSAGAVTAVLAAAAVLMIPARPSKVQPASTGQSASRNAPDVPDTLGTQDSSDEPYVFDGEDEDDWYLDRIIWTDELYRYPVIYMFEDQEYEFTTDPGTGSIVSVSARKSKEHLKLTCTFKDGKQTKFDFDDVYSEKYQQLGHSINTDFEKTTPQYEILFDDINQDRKTEMLITLAWRERRYGADSPDRFYYTEYSTLWVVYADEKNHLCCSEPLYFEGDEPVLESDFLVFNHRYSVWYRFVNGKWEEDGLF